jgi:O-antigen ligase
MIRNLARPAALASLAFGLVTVTLRPGDSIEVEAGAALYLLPIAALAFVAAQLARPMVAGRDEVFGWLLIGWLALGTTMTRGVGDVRQAINELSVWVTLMLVVAATRRAFSARCLPPILFLIVALCGGLSVFAAHQQWISLPADRARFASDPDGVLRDADIVAPDGSPQRVMFVSRLMNNGPTATFALANSLAAFLMLGIPATVGVTLTAWRQPNRIGPVVICLTVLVAALIVLVWTDSRSAFASLAVGVGTGSALHWRRRRMPVVLAQAAYPARLRWGWLATVAAGCVATILLPLVSATWDWFPRSLQFRFQYWNATLRMIIDHPGFGAGPGNFQQRYGRYRMDQASESISDPHNWLMEILGAGGIVAASLFCLAVVFAVRGSRGRNLQQASSAAESNSDENPRSVGQRKKQTVARASNVGKSNRSPLAATEKAGLWIGVGGAIALPATIGYLLSIFQLPDIDPLTIAIVVVTTVYLTLVRTIPWSPSNLLALGDWTVAALTALTLHLFAAGGLTVPGIALPGAILAGALLSTGLVGEATGESDRSVHPVPARRAIPSVAVSITVAMVTAWYLLAWRPTTASDALMGQAIRAMEFGKGAQSERAFEAAAEADPWAPAPVLAHADAIMRMMLTAPDVAAANRYRERFDRIRDRLIARDPGSPQYRALLAQQSLTLYQRWGEEIDLEQAASALTDALTLAPNQLTWVAQMAAIAGARGRAGEATALRQRATELSAAGGHAERDLRVVDLIVVQPIGQSILRTGPQRISAAQLFAATEQSPR